MNLRFVDTSYWLALELKNDQSHAAAQAHWKIFVQSPFALVTTSYVFDETVTYFNSRGFHEKAVKIGETVLQSPSVKLVHIDESLFYEGWEFFQQHQDKRYSLTDCISFLVMKKKNLETALTFDKHFSQAGFIIEP
ncbi:MAG: type II toxin-antitoxin system VapC family toxin [Acidobacteriota bacterium]|nr:type II toxin-antitoxin system VapC family toxin [Acidobacteriota bacterium]